MRLSARARLGAERTLLATLDRTVTLMMPSTTPGAFGDRSGYYPGLSHPSRWQPLKAQDYEAYAVPQGRESWLVTLPGNARVGPGSRLRLAGEDYEVLSVVTAPPGGSDGLVTHVVASSLGPV